MSIRSRLLSTAVCLLAFSGSVLAAEYSEKEVRELVQRSAAALQKINNYSCRTLSLKEIKLEDKEFIPTIQELAEPFSDGLFLLRENDVVQDRVGRRAWCRGRHFSISSMNSKIGRYLQFENAYDGHRYRTYGSASNTGQILPYNHEMATYISLGVLLGDNVIVPGDSRSGLMEWLEEPAAWKLEGKSSDECIRLTKTVHSETYGMDLRIVTDISVNHDCLPKLIEVSFCDTNTLHQRVTVEEFGQVGEEKTWVPLKGWHEGFYRDAVFPPGVTAQIYDKMTEEERGKVDPLITWRAVHLLPPELVVIDKESLKINSKLKAEDFVVRFPPTSKIYDGFQRKLLRGGKTPIPDPPAFRIPR